MSQPAKMNPPLNLTDGAIATLSSEESLGISHDLQPVLQVADIRLVSTPGQNGNTERYRLLLSDGTFKQQGMLGTQLNELVRSGELQKGSIVLLTKCVCNLVQNRIIIIIIGLEVLVEKCDPIGEPSLYPSKINGNAPSVTRPPAPVQTNSQSATYNGSHLSSVASSANASVPRPNWGGGIQAPPSGDYRNTAHQSYGSSVASNMGPGRYNSSIPSYPKPEYGSAVSRAPANNYVRPPQSTYNQPPPMYANRGPIAKNDAAPRISPIAALNPYQVRWTIKARVTAKGELRHYSNPRGDGKVFSFDLLDSDGGEIRVTCFNDVADQFYQQIEPGRVYIISRGTVKPAQKAFNHLQNEHEIFLDSASTVQPCFEDDASIPKQQFHFRPIIDIESLNNNSVMDVIGVVSSVSPVSSIMTKNGRETQKRTLQLKDMSGRSVELTMWGNFCNAEGQTLQNMCDSGVFPVLAVKSARVSDFNGKSVGTISTSQLFVEPDFPEAQKLKVWFDNDGKSTPTVPLTREIGAGRTDVRKVISQIKDEKLGTSEKPDWIKVLATVAFIKLDNFCYYACPNMTGDRQCNKKVSNDGDGKWRCDKCDKVFDECDYRYILQMQIQDHTGLTWVTAFQEGGEEIMGVPAKDLYYLKCEEQDDEKVTQVVRNVLFQEFIFKLKVKEETFSDEQRVKSTVVKAEMVNVQTETKYLLDQIAKFNEDGSSVQPKIDNYPPFGTGINRGSATPGANYGALNSKLTTTTQLDSHSNTYGGSTAFPSSGRTSNTHTTCTSCFKSGHTSENCPSIMSVPEQSYGSGYGNNANSGPSVSGECYKCHQPGHWARDCPGANKYPSAYGNRSAMPGGYAMGPRQHVGGL